MTFTIQKVVTQIWDPYVKRIGVKFVKENDVINTFLYAKSNF